MTIGQSQPRTTDLTQQELARVERGIYSPGGGVEGASGPGVARRRTDARQDGDYRAALVKLADYDDFIDRVRLVGVPVLGALLVIAALICLLLGLFRRLARAVPYYAATIGCAVAVLLLVRANLEVAPLAPRHANQQVALMSPPMKAEARRFAGAEGRTSTKRRRRSTRC